MSLQNFIPQVWSGKLLLALQKNLVFGQAGVANRNYEGDIKGFGDTVKINSFGDVTLFDYAKGMTIPAAEQLNSAQRTLVIDQAKAFNFMIDDIDVAQMNPKIMGEVMARAAYQLADKADQFIAGLFLGVDAANVLGTDVAPVAIANGSQDAYDVIVDLGVKLDKANIQKAGRYLVVGPDFHGALQKAKLLTNPTQLGDAIITNGVVGGVAGFNVLVSNNIPAGKLYAGTNDAISFAEQIAELDAYEPHTSFSDAVKGLHVYGGKLVRPEGIAVATVTVS